MEIQGKTFFITGGGSGLGEATAYLLAECGANLAIADISREAGERVVAKIGAQACFVQADVTSEESVQNAIDATLQAFGALHGVVNCAGIAIAEKVLGRNGPHSLASFSRVIQINLIGTFNVTRLAAAVMARDEVVPGRERGVIINVASCAAFDGQIGQAAYSASKGAIAALTLPLARELARYGVRVMTIAPGIFDTAMMAGLPEAARQSLGQQVPFPPRLGRASEFAALARHIVENEMLNGEVIRLDGALRMAAK